MIGVEGEQLGVVTISEALRLGEEAGLELVEISPNSTPPVCKIMDYGKYRFEQKKKEKDNKKKQKIVQVKELTMSPAIEKHDYEVKLKHAMGFLEDGDKVKFTVKFRGREIAHKEMGEAILERFQNDLAELGAPEKKPVLEGKRMMLIIAPKK